MFYWRPYVPVAMRRREAARKVPKLLKKGERAAPVVLDGRTIARTFWGKAWCDNLERYSDYANRLPRGRTYVRNGSVAHLKIASGAVHAIVSGSEIYKVEVKVAAVSSQHWSGVCRDCAGGIDSLVELLQGRFSTAVMSRICREKTGLFPTPGEMTFKCSCPDWASMCKHVAAVLYGIGARLDTEPSLLFLLRNVDAQDLIAQAGKGLATSRKVPASKKILSGDDLGEMFGIDMAEPEASKPVRKPAAKAAAAVQKRQPKRAPARKATPRGSKVGLVLVKTAKPAKPARKAQSVPPAKAVGKPAAETSAKLARPKRLAAAQRRKIAQAMRARWAARKKSRS